MIQLFVIVIVYCSNYYLIIVSTVSLFLLLKMSGNTFKSEEDVYYDVVLKLVHEAGQVK